MSNPIANPLTILANTAAASPRAPRINYFSNNSSAASTTLNYRQLSSKSLKQTVRSLQTQYRACILAKQVHNSCIQQPRVQPQPFKRRIEDENIKLLAQIVIFYAEKKQKTGTQYLNEFIENRQGLSHSSQPKAKYQKTQPTKTL